MFFFLLLIDCQGYKPLINPNVPELKLNEGEKLEITCTSIEYIEPHYPEDDSYNNVSLQSIQIHL